jgi:hypothetical protein
MTGIFNAREKSKGLINFSHRCFEKRIEQNYQANSSFSSVVREYLNSSQFLKFSIIFSSSGKFQILSSLSYSIFSFASTNADLILSSKLLFMTAISLVMSDTYTDASGITLGFISTCLK